MVQVAAHSRAWLDEGLQGQLTRRLQRAVVWSLTLHLAAFILVTWVRLPQHGERPLASIEISLASLPTPPVKTAEPVKTVEPVKTPVKQMETPVPTPPAKSAPVAPPAMQRAAAVPSRSAADPMRDLLKGIELPPDAPKFGDFSPADKPKKGHETTVPNAPKLKLPDIPVVSEAKVATKKPVETRLRPSLTEELNRELDEELNKIKKLELPKESKAAHAESQPAVAPQLEAKAPSIKSVDTTLKVSSTSPGSNAYLALVRRKISSMWSAPPVDVTAQAYTAIVRFRLNRDGSVSGVAVEQSSGNGYFDDAAKRAVRDANPLPNFPADLPDSYFDAHFTFTVGEQNG